MIFSREQLLATLVLCALLPGTTAGAGELYRWVDDDGVVNFSQWAPADSRVEATTLYIAAENAEDYDPAADDYSIENQAKRTGDVWQKVKDRRAAAEELRRQREEERWRREQQTAYYQPEPYYVRSVYRPYYPFIKRPHRFAQQKPLPHRRHNRAPGNHGGRSAGRSRGMREAPLPGTRSRQAVRFAAPPRRASQQPVWQPARSALPRQVRVLH